MRSRHIARVIAFSTVSTLALLSPQSALADGWSDVGASGRPSWVDEGAERRLNLLPALPGIESGLDTQAKGYFGNKGPGMSVGLVLPSWPGLYYSQGFGFSNAAKTKTPDEYTVFRPGSFSKVITGTGLLTLIDAPGSSMSLKDAADKSQYLPELKYVCPSFNVTCTRGSQNLGIELGNLASHTSGLPDVMEQTNASDSAWLADLKKSWLLFPAGTAQAYSGVGTEAEGLIEQRLSGEKYPDFIKSHLFTPLGMTQSTMDPTTVSAGGQAQMWELVPNGNSLSFTQASSFIAGDDQPMILPAGGLATSVRDLSFFMRMWLTGDAPNRNGHPILTLKTIEAAPNSFESSTSPPPSGPPCNNKNGTNDSNNFGYSPCGPAFGFGVNWYVGAPPYIKHNGSYGITGSNTVVDQDIAYLKLSDAERKDKKNHGMAATGLISTEPAPGVPLKKALPAGLNSDFMDTLVQTLLTSGIAADATTSWAGQELPDGVARVLWLSGKNPAQSDLDAFTPGMISDNSLTSSNVVSFLTHWQNQVGSCSTFRVRSVQNQNQITVRFYCEKKNWDVALTVGNGADHKVKWVDLSGTTSAAASHQDQVCTAGCYTDEGHCMQDAHSGPERGVCVHEMEACRDTCERP